MTLFEKTRKELIVALARAAPHDGTAVLVAVPGNAVSRIFQTVAPEVLRIETISPGLMQAVPGLVRGFDLTSDWLVVDREAGEIACEATHGMGRTGVFLPDTRLRHRALGDMLAQLANPSFLYIAAAPGHTDLLISVLPQLENRGAIIWIDMPRDAGLQCQALLDTVSEAFEVYALSQSRPVALPGDVAPAEVEGLVLLPKSHWTGFGLRLLAETPQAQPILSDLVVPVARGASSGVLAMLHAVQPGLPNVPVPKKIYIPALGGVFATHARSRPAGDGRFLVASHSTIELTFVPPSAGLFDIGIVVTALPDPSTQANLVLHIGQHILPFVWHGDWWQFRSTRPLLITDSHRAVTLVFSRPHGTSALSIKGLELVNRDPVGSGHQDSMLVSSEG